MGSAQAVDELPRLAEARGSCIAPASIWRSLFWVIFLSGYFFVVYLSCNSITARRSDVGQAAFAWERYIPFMPAMIIPYMSIDLFFFAAPFFCTRQEQIDHARRVVLAIS